MGYYKVLIVEDEPLSRLGIRSLAEWEAYGFTITADAENGEEALSYFENGKDYPDLIFTDIEMPVMNGLEMIRRVHEFGNTESLFVILSVYDDFLHARQALQLNVFDYLPKLEISKEKIEQILQRAKEWLDHHSAGKSRNIQEEPHFSREVCIVREYIKTHYPEEITLADIVTQTGYSQGHMSQLFRSETGMSIMEYLNNHRIEEAKILLRETSLRSYEIAEKVGIMDANYFSRLFRQRTGMGAHEYRRNGK